MHPYPFLASLILAATQATSLAAQLNGVVTDRSGNPLSGVVVKLVSTGDSTRSASDGSWRLGWSTGSPARNPSRAGASGILVRQEGRLRLDVDGCRIDGKREALGGGGTIPAASRSPRASSASSDTLALRWKGASFKRPLTSSVQVDDLGRTSLDTAGLERFEIRASRHEVMGLAGLRLDVLSMDSSHRDSLALRLHMTGTAVEMADFAAFLDIAQYFDAAGFNRPARIASAKVSRQRPRLAEEGCAIGDRCDWAFDIPLDSLVFAPQSRLEIRIVFTRHVQAGDTTGMVLGAPTHDPYAGADWSFRPHWRDATMDYAGVPAMARDEVDSLPILVPVNPYVQLVRGGLSIYGRPPESED